MEYDFSDDEVVIVAQKQPDNYLRVQVNADNSDLSVTVNFPAGYWPTLAEIRKAVRSNG
jgi:hypothetical protein